MTAALFLVWLRGGQTGGSWQLCQRKGAWWRKCGVRPNEVRGRKVPDPHIGEMREATCRKVREPKKKEWGWVRMSLIKPPTGKGVKECQEEGAAWPLPISPPSRALVVLPACGHTNAYTCSLVHACASTTAWLGVNKGSGCFNKAEGMWQVRGKGIAFLAGCGCLCLTRPACRQALCRWNEAMG